jgi:hypothetical protein
MKTITKLIVLYLLINQIVNFEYLKVKSPPEFLVNQKANTSLIQGYPRVAALSNGNFVVVYHTSTTQTAAPPNCYWNILLNVYDSTGNKLTANDIIINNPSSLQAVYPNICTDDKGGFVVVWEETNGQNNTMIYAKYYDSTFNPGQIVSVKVDTTMSPTWIGAASCTRLISGNWVVTFSGHSNGKTGYAQILDPTLQLIGGNFTTQDTNSVEQVTSVVGLLNGGFITVGHNNKSGNNDIYAKVFDKGGNAKGNEILINTNAQAGIQEWPKMTLLKNGNIVITWDDKSVSPTNVVYKIFDQNCNGISSFFTFSTQSSGGGPWPFALISGGFGIVFNNKSTKQTAMLQIFESAGNTIEPAKLITTDPNYDYGILAAAELVNGTIVVAWQVASNRVTSSDIFVQILYKNNGECQDFKFYKGMQQSSLILDFTPIIYDSIVLKTLPTNGKAKDDKSVDIVLNTFADKTKVFYSSASSQVDTFTFATNTIDPSCKADILLCYMSCLSCMGAGDNTNHNCTQCASGLYKISGASNCYSSTDLVQGYYFDSFLNVFAKCYSTCLSCTGKGDSTNNNCILCPAGYEIKGVPTNCILKADTKQGFYFDSVLGTMVKCYSSCYDCLRKGDSVNHNCSKCNTNFFPLDDNSSLCYGATETVQGYFFKTLTKTFSKCFDSCSKCVALGDKINNLCTACKTNYFNLVDNKFMCYTKDSIVVGYYFDTANNIFNKCYQSCNQCSGPGDIFTPNCTQCVSSLTECGGCTQKVYKDNCIADCPILTIFDSISKQCKDCQTGQVVYNNECVSTCPPGYVMDITTCVSSKSVDKCPVGYIQNNEGYCILVKTNNYTACTESSCKETCASNVCQNGGVCSIQYNKATCTCASTFIGQYCQIVGGNDEKIRSIISKLILII